MIPKILHTSFFGDWPWTPLNLRCQESWKKYLPDWEIKHWGPECIPENIQSSAWMREAMRPFLMGHKLSGSQLNFHAYLRHYVLNKYGGVWIDNDVEFLREPDLFPEFFIGWQTDVEPHTSLNCSTLGGVPDHWFNRECIRRLEALDPGCSPTLTGPELVTSVLQFHGLRMNGQDQVVRGVQVYAKDVLYPWAWFEEPSRSKLTERTVAIHWWEGSWSPGNRHPAAKDRFPD